LIITGVLLAGFIVHAYFNYSADKELEQEFAAIKDSGCPLSLEGFAPPPVPDEENAAVLYKRAFDMFDPGEGEQEVLWKKIRSYGTLGWSLPWNFSSEEKETIRAILDKNSKVFELLKEAASYKRSRLPFYYGEELDVKPPSLGWTPYCIRFLAVKALVESEEGKIDDALETCRVNLHLTNILYSESALITQIIRTICQQFIYQILETVFERGEAGLPQCRALLEEIDSYGTEAPLVRSLESLRCFRVEIFKRMLKGDPKALARLGQSKPTPRQKLMMRLRTSWFAHPILKKDFAYFLREWQKLIASHKFPCAGKRYEYPRKLPRYYMLTRLILPRFTVGVTQAAESETLARVCQLALATMIYRKEKDNYPDSLDQLAPTIIKALPKDPFSGGNFLYRQEKKGFIVYSAGKNLKDDGGEEDDIAWRYKK
jgi:hypothetical protein